MNTIIKTLKKLAGVVAPLALALAVVTANSTCICFSNQPTPPAALNKYKAVK